ncbi:MAG: hypothetical protein ACKPGW_17495 [Microcystis panniformis]
MEVTANIKQGLIELPEEYQQDVREDSEVQVIVIKQTTTRTNSELKNKEIIDDLTENSVKVSGFLSRDEIYNRQS